MAGLGGGSIGCWVCEVEAPCSILGLAVFGWVDTAGVNSTAKDTVLCWNSHQFRLGILLVKSWSHAKNFSLSLSWMFADFARWLTKWLAYSFMTLISSLKWDVFSSLSVSLVLFLVVLHMGGGEVSAEKFSGVSFLVGLVLLSWPLSSAGSSSDSWSVDVSTGPRSTPVAWDSFPAFWPCL